MPIDRAHFTVKVNSEADTAGIQRTIAQLQKMRDAAASAGQETVYLDAAIEKSKVTLQAASRAHEEAAKAGQKLDLTHRQLHQSIELIGQASSGALGPLGELAHFLSSPYLLAAEGAALAIKMLIDRYKELHENTLKNIEASRQQAEIFRNAHSKAVEDDAAAVAKWNTQLAHAADHVDKLTEAMKRNIAVGQENLKNTEDLIGAVERLFEARIKASGADKLTQDAMLVHSKQKEEEERHRVEMDQKQKEIDAKRGRASSAQGEAETAEGQISGLRGQSQDKDEQLLAAKLILSSAQSKLEDLQKAAEDARLDSAESAKRLGGLNPGAIGAEKKAREAEKAVAQQQSLIDAQIHLVARYSAEKEAVDANIASLQELVTARSELARSLTEEWKASASSLQSGDVAFQRKQAIDAQAAMTEHMAALREAIAGGKANGTESQEFETANSNSPFTQSLRAMRQHLSELNAHRQSRTDTSEEMQSLLGEIMGLLDKLVMHPGIQDAAQIRAQLEQLESNLANSRTTH